MSNKYNKITMNYVVAFGQNSKCSLVLFKNPRRATRGGSEFIYPNQTVRSA